MTPAERAKIQPRTFKWVQCDPEIYDNQGDTVYFKAGGQKLYRPVVGDLSIQPNTGKHFWEVRINCENACIGLCTEDIDMEAEFGKGRGQHAVLLQTDVCLCEGVEKKKIWRMVVPIAGAWFGCIYDSNEGTMQIYMNGEFQGTAISEAFGLKGKTVRPCVGIAGVEQNNRNIGIGQKKAVITKEPQLYRALVL